MSAPAGEHDGTFPDEAFLCALSNLSWMGPARLRSLVRGRGAQQGWHLATSPGISRQQVEREVPGILKVRDQWVREARDLHPATIWQRHLDAGIGVAMLGSPSMPSAFADDHDPPTVLFHVGNLDALDGRRVAIVGTRRATRYGLDVAEALGHDLAAAGVHIVSGLAGGIDAAAHKGALRAGEAPPIAVVGSGVDIVYPRRNRELWAHVVATGALLTEYPLGMQPEPWHFPARNRLVAALAEVLVVVESPERGGSMYTVDEAERRDRPVLAVPGSVRSPVSAGTNALLASGCGPCRDAQDVLVALGLQSRNRPVAQRAPEPPAELAPVLEALEWQPVTFEQLLVRTSLDPGELSVALTRLGADGWLEHRSGFYERVTRDARR